MKIITVTNQKGGSGKSVVSSNCLFYAMEQGLRVMALDLDPQASLSGVTLKGRTPALSAAAFVSEKQTDTAKLKDGELLINVSASAALRRATVDHKILQANLKAYEGLIDVVVIDTAGSINSLAQAAMMCSTHVVCPVEVGEYELDALMPLLENIKTITQQFNPRLKNIGLLPSKVYTQSLVTRADLQMMRETLGKRVMPQQLNFRSSVQLSVKQKKPVWKVAKDKATKDAWRSICQAIVC